MRRQKTHSRVIPLQKLVVCASALQGLDTGTFSSDGKGACYSSITGSVGVSLAWRMELLKASSKTPTSHGSAEPIKANNRTIQNTYTAPNRHMAAMYLLVRPVSHSRAKVYETQIHEKLTVAPLNWVCHGVSFGWSGFDWLKINIIITLNLVCPLGLHQMYLHVPTVPVRRRLESRWNLLYKTDWVWVSVFGPAFLN